MTGRAARLLVEVNRVGHRHIDHHRYHYPLLIVSRLAIATPHPPDPDDGVDAGFRCTTHHYHRRSSMHLRRRRGTAIVL